LADELFKADGDDDDDDDDDDDYEDPVAKSVTITGIPAKFEGLDIVFLTANLDSDGNLSGDVIGGLTTVSGGSATVSLATIDINTRETSTEYTGTGTFNFAEILIGYKFTTVGETITFFGGYKGSTTFSEASTSIGFTEFTRDSQSGRQDKPIELEGGEEWYDGNLGGINEEYYFWFHATSGTTYNVFWDDYYQGSSGSTTADICVRAAYFTGGNIFGFPSGNQIPLGGTNANPTAGQGSLTSSQRGLDTGYTDSDIGTATGGKTWAASKTDIVLIRVMSEGQSGLQVSGGSATGSYGITYTSGNSVKPSIQFKF